MEKAHAPIGEVRFEINRFDRDGGEYALVLAVNQHIQGAF
jgi:hypothetical protein